MSPQWLSDNSTSDLQWLAGHLSHWELVALLIIVVAVFVLTRLAEAHDSVAKMVPGLGQWARRRQRRRERDRKEEIREEARKLIAELEPTETEQELQAEVKDLKDRMNVFEEKEEIYRSYLIYDETWHFRDSQSRASTGQPLPERITFREFEIRYRSGYRLDDDGHWRRGH